MAKKSSLKKRPQRGIVLLIVISLLALFVLLGVTYALVATGYNQAAKTAVQIGRVGDTPDKEMDLVVFQLLCDTMARSAIRGHGLLSDLYGDSVEGEISSNPAAFDTLGTSATQPQAWSFNFTPVGTFSKVLDYYTGRVITFHDLGGKDYSTRVLQYFYDANTTQYSLVVEAIESQGGIVSITNGTHFVINGAPFNGSGAGYDNLTYNLNAVYVNGLTVPGTIVPPPTDLVALLPHFNGYDLTSGTVVLNPTSGTPTYRSADQVGIGGFDESYDAVDFQNMFLAMVPPSAAVMNTDTNGTNNIPIIPSFHRPELVHYWVEYMKTNIVNTLTNQAEQYQVMAQPYGPDGIRGNADEGGTPWSSVQLEQRDRIYNITRCSIFRPMMWDHPNFTGSNPAFNSTNWKDHFDSLINFSNLSLFDVDNDNDTVPDSIWIDPGLPIITGPDGKRYKRLAAILVKDQDGRIDLNAAGNLAQVTETPAMSGNYNYRGETSVQGGLMTASRKLVRGLGFGPAEMDFGFLVGDDYNVYGGLLRGRYGSGQLPGQASTRDGLDIVKHHGIPNDYANEMSWYGTPPDVWGAGAIALDYGGQPLFAFMGLGGDMLDNPYQLSLSGQFNGQDNPYAPVELEKMLRFHDPDARHLDSRPIALASTYLATSMPGMIDDAHTLREKFTVISSRIPCPSVSFPRELRTNYRLENSTLLDLYRAKVDQAISASNPNTAAQVTSINRILAQILPWEIRHGQPFDLNRWFGNGYDLSSNNNNVPDEAAEGSGGQEQAWSNDTNALYGPPASAPSPFAGTIAQGTNGMDADMDGNNDSATTPDLGDRALVRQLYARHLFCMLGVLSDNFNFAPIYTETGVNAPELAIRRLAQWCINVVDFRDPDAIMTPFEYDINPLNGWQVDGNLATDGSMTAPEQIDTDNNAGAENHQTNERRVCWGVEYPDLMLMETVAFHDRRTKDTAQDSAMQGKVGNMGSDRDDEVDQFRIPQGSLFVELYCPRNRQTANQRFANELYTYDNANTEWRLDIGKIHATADSAGVRHPVWQIVISEQTLGNASKEQSTPLQRPASGKPDSTSFDPSNMNGLPGTAEPLTPDRLIWFSNYQAPLGTFEGDRAFVNNQGWDVSIAPGQYAVVGPRLATYMGSADDGNAGTPYDGNASQGITLKQLTRTNPADTGVSITDTAGGASAYVAGTSIKSVVGIVADMRPPSAPGAALPWMNVNRRIGLNISEPLPQTASYYPEPNVMNDGRNPPDAYDDLITPTQSLPDLPLDGQAGKPLAAFGSRLYKSDSYQDVRSIFLQRLANPLEPWNPDPADPVYGGRYDNTKVVNPYITVDWSTVDLTVYNGEENIKQQSMMGNKDFDPADPSAGAFDYDFYTRQRGPTTFANSVNPWSSESQTPQDTNPAAAAMAYFKHDLVNSLGYVNSNVSTPYAVSPYIGEPQKAFPWLAWNNRPFSTPYELMLVPTSTPSRLFYEFPKVDGYVAPELAAYDPYTTYRTAANLNPPTYNLLNFFHTHQTAGQSPLHQRLFDYVEVPSPFMGAERWYNPSQFGNAGLYRPPFNKMSRFRDAGRLNINTMFDADIWRAVVGHTPDTSSPNNTLADFYDEIYTSRQGFTGTTMNAAWPTRFGNPFRPADAADLMPNVPAGAGGMRKLKPIDATLLRPDVATATKPLLQMNPASQWTEEFRDIRRNPYFRYQPYQKLANILTTNSNCFAVWITIGYFEVEENATVDAAHPDGYRLGQEVGFDTGEVTRHRSFFIIDRSVPVGFQPGIRHNADKCILLRRFIE